MRNGDDFRRTIELVAGSGTVAVCTLIYVLAVGRALGPTDYADFSAALSLFYLVTVVLSPLAPTTARLVARYVERGEIHRAGALHHALLHRVGRWTAMAAIPLLLITIPLAHALHFASPVSVALSFAAAGAFTIANIQRGTLQGLGRFREQNLNQIVEAALRLVAAIVILLYIPTASGALAAYAGALVIAALLLRKRTPSTSDEEIDWRDVKRLAAPMFVAMIGLSVSQYADLLAVKRWFSATEAGHYGAASTLARSIGVVFVPIYVVAGPLLTRLHERNEPLLPDTLRLCGFFVALAAAPTAVFAFAGEWVVTILYGPAFREAGPILSRLCGVSILLHVSLILGQALITTGDRRFGRIYLSFAIVQLAALYMARGSIGSIILSLYVVQGVLMLVMFLTMMRLRAE